MNIINMIGLYIFTLILCKYHFLDFSLTNWVQNNTLRVGEQLAEGAVTLLLEQLNLTNFFKKPRCDRNRVPYIPSVQGIHNGKAIHFIEHVVIIYKYCTCCTKKKI